jgi:hypothetical protein
MIRAQIESMDDITAIGDEGVASSSGISRTSFRSCRQRRNEGGVVIPSALAQIADAKAVRCRAAANGVMGHFRKSPALFEGQEMR